MNFGPVTSAYLVIIFFQSLNRKAREKVTYCHRVCPPSCVLTSTGDVGRMIVRTDVPNVVYYWPAYTQCRWDRLVTVAGVCRRLSSSVTLSAGGRDGRRVREWSGGRHCNAGQYGHVQLERHLVLLVIES